MKRKLTKYFPAFVLPTAAAFAVSFIVPFIMGLYLSFCSFTTVKNSKWTGLEDYCRIFSNRDFRNALVFTIK
ncbi:MAG: sugar ABC transporter permease, partial [Huintestinicola sp.]